MFWCYYVCAIAYNVTQNAHTMLLWASFGVLWGPTRPPKATPKVPQGTKVGFHQPGWFWVPSVKTESQPFWRLLRQNGAKMELPRAAGRAFGPCRPMFREGRPFLPKLPPRHLREIIFAILEQFWPPFGLHFASVTETVWLHLPTFTSVCVSCTLITMFSEGFQNRTLSGEMVSKGPTLAHKIVLIMG